MTKTLAIALLGASLAACGGSGGGDDDDDTGGGGGTGGTVDCGPMVGDGDEVGFTTPGIITDTVNDSVNGGVLSGAPTGADPVDIYMFTAPTAGTYVVTLNWDNAGNDLDLEVYDLLIDNTDPVARSTAQNTNTEQVTVNAPNDARDLHLLVLAWDTACVEQTYMLTVAPQ